MPSDPEVVRDIETLLAGTSDVDALERIVRDLIKSHRLVRLTREKAFGEILDCMGSLISHAPDETSRLKAIATVMRVAAVAKSSRKDIEELLSRVVEGPLVPPSSLPDADDRLYLAVGLRSVPQDWVVPYAASAAVEEESGERARSEFLSVVVDRSPNLEAVFAHLISAYAAVSPQTESPGDSAARRLRRIINALRIPIVSSLSDAGVDLATQLAPFVEAAFSASGKPESGEVQQTVAEDLAALIHDIVRTRVQVLADSAIYSAMRVPRRWMDPAYWRYFAAESQSINLLVKDLLDAIVLLGKQGVMSNSIRNELAQLVGSRDAAEAIVKKLAKSREDLPGEVRQWLLTGRHRQAHRPDAAEASAAATLDSRLANALVDSEKLREAAIAIGEDALAEIELLNPSLFTDIRTLLVRANQLAKQVGQVAERRGIRIAVPAGEVQDYSPVAHVLPDGSPIGRRVHLNTPIVEQVAGDKAEVILKAAVEVLSD